MFCYSVFVLCAYFEFCALVFEFRYMRIITGRYKGRVIKMPKGIRPTQGLVRKALFDILGDIEGLSFLELFAGSGAIGIEALSRGAKEVVFAEREKRCRKIIQQNLRYVNQLASEQVSGLASERVNGLKNLTGEPANAASGGTPPFGGGRQTILNMDSMQTIILLFHKKQKFDIIFLDPPYHRPEGHGLASDSQSHKEMSKKILQMLGAYDILAPNGFVVVQHFKKEQLPKESGKLTLIKESRYGDTILSFYKKKQIC